MALGCVYLTPALCRSLNATANPATLNHPPAKYIWPSIIAPLISTAAIALLVFGRGPAWGDCVVAGLLCFGIVQGRPKEGPTRTSITRLLRTYLKIIMENSDSRKIFYFLMVNLAYMVVQLLWGFWTNSLGLVSDGESNLSFPHLGSGAVVSL